MVIPADFRFGFLAELDNKEFQAFCIALANDIDAATGENEVPGNVQELACVLMTACRRIWDDRETKAAVMTLMISAKSACELGWFPQKETQQLLATIDMMWTHFSSPENVTPSVNSPASLILQVTERFYPCVKLGDILVSFETKPETKILMKDFHILKRMPHSSPQIVGLFVVKTEDISKSSCIVHPQEVSFLLNGKGVDKRFNISMELGAQLPTDVTALVNTGANLLQTIGCFGGSYLIAIALMDFIPLPDKPLLKDYVHPEVVESDSDCDIIEGASRISLSCPISRTRIKLPVKGHVCKHLQCFDFWNYVTMNSRRPSWRCPHCNQSVCYVDIRVDQKMKKILEEVGLNAAHVLISADGSWTVVTENDEDVELVPETTQDHGDPNSFINLEPTGLDLARDENEMETSGGTQVHEHNPILNQSSASFSTLPPLPQTLDSFDGRQQFMNLPQVVNTLASAARQALPVTYLPSSYPQNRLAANASNSGTSILVGQSSQLQGSHAMSLGNCEGRTSDLMERWNTFCGINQTQLPPAPVSQNHYAMQNQSQFPAQQRPVSSRIAHTQTLPVIYGGNTNQRQMQLSVQQLQTLLNLGGNAHQRLIPYSTTHVQTLPVSYGGNAHQRPMPPSITRRQSLPVNYGGTADQRPISSSLSHHQTLPVYYRRTADQRSMPRPMPSSNTHLQTSSANYGGDNDQRPMPPSNTHLQTSSANYRGANDQRPMPPSNTHLQTSSANYRGANDQRPMPPSNTHLQTSSANYGGTNDHRPMPPSNTHFQTSSANYGGTNNQIHNHSGLMEQFSTRESMNMTPDNTANWRPQSRMRGSVAPGMGYDHMMIQPTQPVEAQAQTLPPPQPTPNNPADEIQTFPSYPTGANQMQAGTSASPMAEGLEYSGSYWSMPPEAW